MRNNHHTTNQQAMADIKEELDTLKDNLKGTFAKSGEALSEKSKILMDNTLENFREKVGRITDMAKSKYGDIDEVVHENPWKTAGAALAIGLVVGLLFRRSKD